jgi:hypothetical protein
MIKQFLEIASYADVGGVANQRKLLEGSDQPRSGCRAKEIERDLNADVRDEPNVY